MNMKKMGLISAVGFTALMGASLATNALADDHKGDHKEGKGKYHQMEMRDPGKMADRLADSLDLDEATKAKVTALLEKRSVEMRSLRESHKAELVALLTPEQAEKFESMEKRRGMKDKHHGKGMKYDQENKG
jgi:Spy/CpxP family protein refolding chaperone